VSGVIKALVTGGGSGIGEAIALRLAADGARVLIVGRDASKLQTVAARAPQNIDTLVADLTSEADLLRLVERAVAWDGTGINILVNNAGMGSSGFFEDADTREIKTLLQSNLVAPLCLTQALLAHLRSLPEAHIVNIGSVFGYIGYPSQAVYSASKFGLRGFSEALRRELAGSAVQVHHIAPRATRTAMTAATGEMNRRLGNRVDEPARVAAVLARMLSRRQANAVVGWPEAFFVRVNSLFPSLVDGALSRQLPVLRQFIQGGARP
jgi:short-subunit dehydrogenase